MHRIASIVAAATVVTAAAITGAGPAFAVSSAHPPARHRAPAPAPTYYVSLGDSLAQGVQPNAKGVSVETNQGYANQLYTALKMGNPTLKLEKLGCPGETTASMIKGGICKYADGSQLAQAVAFLKAHAAATQVVTIDIGANDLNPCVVLTSVPKIVQCLNKVFPPMLKNLATIMTELRTAGGTSLKIVGMTYYVPELAEWLAGGAGQQIADASPELGSIFGQDLRVIYKKFGAPVASLYQAFDTQDIKTMVTLPAFGKVPKDVAMVCYYTWECAPKPQGPNEHANVLGYGLIANTFLKVIAG
ncbi:MAG TPA: SGNH/GDSL hydrolase family protein [Streptosporangiaceae bacterium]|nr:SGNH/GDSL hydrolase family protein [Streptosporangiaceae bacterium]